MLLMNRRNLFGKWNSKYIHTTVPHSAASIGFEYLLGHNVHIVTSIYRVIQEESAILWEMIVCVILSKKVHMYMGPILNGYRDMVKRR